jgi:hypothetical protein
MAKDVSLWSDITTEIRRYANWHLRGESEESTTEAGKGCVLPDPDPNYFFLIRLCILCGEKRAIATSANHFWKKIPRSRQRPIRPHFLRPVFSRPPALPGVAAGVAARRLADVVVNSVELPESPALGDVKAVEAWHPFDPKVNARPSAFRLAVRCFVFLTPS